MKTSLSIACAQSRVVLGPAVSSRMRILRTGKVAEMIRRCYTPRFIPQGRCHSLGHKTAPSFEKADKLDSSRDEQGLCNSLGSHCVGVTLQDSKEAQCPTGEDHLKGEVRDEHASNAVDKHSCGLENYDNETSTVVTDRFTLERADSVVVSRLPTSNDGRLEELAKAVEILNRSLLSVIEQLENLVRQKETLNGSHNSSQVVKGMNQSAMRRDGLKPAEKIDPSVIGDEVIAEKDPQSPISRMEMKEKVPKREAQRILVGISGSKRGNGKLNQHRAAIQRIREYDEIFMRAALEEARKAAMAGEIPVGAVIVQKGKIVARAYNRVESDGDPTAHAEMLCLRSAARHRGDWRLVDATLYVTLEPCPMCAGAILQSRVKAIVWGSRNTLLGADGSWVSLFPGSEEEVYVESAKSEHKPCCRPLTHPFNTSIEVRREVLADDCATVMRNFFKTRRKENGNFMKTMPWWLPLSAWVLFKKLLLWLTTLSKD